MSENMDRHIYVHVCNGGIGLTQKNNDLVFDSSFFVDGACANSYVTNEIRISDMNVANLLRMIELLNYLRDEKAREYRKNQVDNVLKIGNVKFSYDPEGHSVVIESKDVNTSASIKINNLPMKDQSLILAFLSTFKCAN